MAFSPYLPPLETPAAPEARTEVDRLLPSAFPVEGRLNLNGDPCWNLQLPKMQATHAAVDSFSSYGAILRPSRALPAVSSGAAREAANVTPGTPFFFDALGKAAPDGGTT